MSIARSYVALGVALLCVSYVVAQETADPALSPPATSSEQTTNYRGDLKSTDSNIQRASEIIGMNVMTPNNEDTIGEIDDLVLDSENGTIRYAAVSVGGFLGIGDKLVAVPWKAFKRHRDEDGNMYISLDTSKEKLEQAPGFNQDNWPDFANPQWSRENDRHYGVSVNVNTNR